MVIANLSSTISLQFPVLLFSVVWSRSSLFCSCLLAGAPPSVAPLSGCLQEQRRDVTLRPSPIRLGPSSSSSQIHFMMEIAPICVQQHLCTPHVDHRISMSYFWRIFSGVRALVPVESRGEISAGWEMMYGSGVPADADNTLLEYHPERSLETSPSRPETSQLWYGHYGNLCALDAFCVPAPVIETTVMHETVQMERGTINIFGGFKFLMARKSPQYILGCVWCVSMVPVYWAMLRAGWAGSRYLIPRFRTKHNTSYVTFLSTPSAKIRPWTHGTAASEDSFEAGISVLIRGIIRLNWTKRCCPPRSANISEQPSTRLTLLWLNRRPELFQRLGIARSSQDPFDWIIELNDWPDDALDGEFVSWWKEGKCCDGRFWVKYLVNGYVS